MNSGKRAQKTSVCPLPKPHKTNTRGKPKTRQASFLLAFLPPPAAGQRARKRTFAPPAETNERRTKWNVCPLLPEQDNPAGSGTLTGAQNAPQTGFYLQADNLPAHRLKAAAGGYREHRGADKKKAGQKSRDGRKRAGQDSPLSHKNPKTNF